MCGRFYIPENETPEELQAIIDALERRQGQPVRRGEIRPSDSAPVLARSRSGGSQPFLMRWGYTLPDGKLVINARSETAAERPLFADGMQRRRCLIPAGHYYEWEQRGRERIRYAIRPQGQRMLWLAGLYRFEGALPVFTVLTRAPSQDVAFIHDRMPVILPGDAAAQWLAPDAEAHMLLHMASLRMEYGAM
ncbi:MAG: SOS response-associated peptidase [Clostridia bacterium]|nr:SOS response-associated peptidase [Clostridia bacterium]